MGNRTAKGKTTQYPDKKEKSGEITDFGEPKILHRPGRAAVLDSLKQVAAPHARITEYADKSNEELTSAFITSTCQLLPRSSFAVSDSMHDYIMSFYPAATRYLLLCGSAAEFYIRPLNTCIDDTDNLLLRSDELACNGDFPVLPRDRSCLSDTIYYYKIETYDGYPGFVRLRFLWIMNYNWNSKKYEFNHSVHANRYKWINIEQKASMYTLYRPTHISDSTPVPHIVSGPAIKYERGAVHGYLERDVVHGLWCPQWPIEAHGWLMRTRNNGWPTIETISEVVQNGCHVVYVQHRSCRDDKQQWRYSFSMAEVILLQSWTQIQQIVYHLLRFFAKRELIQKDCPKKDEVLCTYHLKTLMLWTCEEMSPEWWNSSSVITICCELLQKLSKWLKKRSYPNYFIPEANLFHKPSSSKMLDSIKRRLNEYRNSGMLCHWFIEYYILPITRTNFEVESTLKVTQHFVNFMLHLFHFWEVSESKSLDLLFSLTFEYSHKGYRPIIRSGFCTGLRLSIKEGYNSKCHEPKANGQLIDLKTIQNVTCFTHYDILLYILHTAYGLGCGEISWDSGPSMILVEFVNAISTRPKIVRSRYHNFPEAFSAQSSRSQFLCAQGLVENLTGSNSRSEFQLVSIMSKDVLKKALEYDAFESNGIAPAALAYIAALQFATAEYRKSLRVCSSVLTDQTPQKEKETLNAGCLLFIDDVARIVGLFVLHQKIKDNGLHYIAKRLYLDLRLSPEVFAHYLSVLAAERMHMHIDFNNEFPDSAFRMDEYLKVLTKAKCSATMKSWNNFNAARHGVCCREDFLTETEDTSVNPLVTKETVIDVLMEYALEHMKSFYSVIRKDFGIQCNTADCYRALYLYKCRNYNEVLNLCEGILREPDLQSDFKELALANILVLPPLDSFFDDDVLSLVGFHTLFYYLSTLNDDMRTPELTAVSTFEHWFALPVHYRCELSYFLQFPYSIKCHYFLGRHFLARYLKVRCCIDCNLPYKEAMTEFAAQKIYLPFEHIIRRFLLRKFRITENSSMVSSY